MKKTSIHLMLSIIFSTIVLVGCTKEKEDEIKAEITKQGLAGSYKLTALTTTVAGMETNSMDQLEVCERDDIYTLNADFTAVYTDAGTKCDLDDSHPTTWELDDNKNISISGSSQDYSGTVKSWDGKTLVIEGTYTIGVTFTIKATFTKQ
jgi:hypothetical protein